MRITDENFIKINLSAVFMKKHSVFENDNIQTSNLISSKVELKLSYFSQYTQPIETFFVKCTPNLPMSKAIIRSKVINQRYDFADYITCT